MKTPLLLIAALLAAAAAQAQTVWRCGADGRSYGDSPCPGGVAVAIADPPSAEAVQAGREVADRDKALAATLTAERQARELEARAAGSGLAGIRHDARHAAPPKFRPKAPRSKSKAKLLAQRHRPADDGTWRAVAQASR